MKRYAFINIPSQELERPPAAAALLGSIIKSIGWDCKVFDFNLLLNDTVTKEVWSELEDYWRCKIDRVSSVSEKQLHQSLEKFIQQLYEYDPHWIGVSVFSRFSTVSCYEILKFLRPKINSKIMIGGHGISSTSSS